LLCKILAGIQTANLSDSACTFVVLFSKPPQWKNFDTHGSLRRKKKEKKMKIDELFDILKEIARESGVLDDKIHKFVERQYKNFESALNDMKKGRTIPTEKLKK
jgi:hypothetical protein